MATPFTTPTEFWRGVLAGGFTPLPRMAGAPVPGSAVYERAIPDGLVAGLHRLADDVGVSLSSALLAAHAKVLAALCGDKVVITGYTAGADRRPLPCRLTTGSTTWRALLTDTHRSASALLAHRDSLTADLLRELDAAAGPETVLDPAGDGHGPAEGTVLWVEFPDRDGRRSLRLRYRTDALDSDAAARIAGYHLTALELIADDPDAVHARQSLVSAEEVRFQIDRLAGPYRELPDRRFHELFEQRVRAHPDAVAAEHAGRRWTYQELNVRANHLGRALLAEGLKPEDVVAVVTERNLDWMAAVLAVFKAGGAYMPVEPHFPAERIATMLSRAGCNLVLTEEGSTADLDRALGTLPWSRRLLIDEAARQGWADGDLGVPVAPDQLAYVYFTSGSTGTPKGAMCEHAGMLNHLYAKIDDLGIDEGRVVAQTAPQCFDISLWQMMAPLLVGGRTLLVEQEAVLDVRRFLDTIVDGRVCVLQVVPSYLDVVLSDLERHPRDLPDLRCVSVTGEALKKELAQRWFAAEPGIPLVNAYGLTETSDDTNHEVMHRAPDTERVPLGRPVNNVHVYVVDDSLSLVPLGAPGAIVFSGVCVGRGYVHDPDRTRLSFMPDPHRPGQRLYRGGDFGRWLPDGKLEYLGRQDAQVKIRGFRIELGEIENTLLKVPGVGDGAVVVVERAGRKDLVGFYSARSPLRTDAIRDRLAEALPAYMVPTTFHWRDSLPLTANGKIDKKALRALAAEPDAADDNHDAPGTPTEQRVAAAWAVVLGIPRDRVGRGDHFFDRGGTSLSAVKLAIALDRTVSLADLNSHPVLADLAALIDGRTEPRPALLRALTESDDARPDALVCFPGADGDAADFQPLADALQVRGLAVYAAAPSVPGAADDGSGSFASMPLVVEQVVSEIVRLGHTNVLLWGQASGTTFALETAKRLQDHGVHVPRVFVGRQVPGDAVSRRTDLEHVALHELPDGGHHFLRARAEEAAEAVLHALTSPALS